MADDASESPDHAGPLSRLAAQSVERALGFGDDDLRDEARATLEKLVETVIGQVHDDHIPDPCKTAQAEGTDPAVAQACLTLQLALKTNGRAEDKAVAAARSTLSAARDEWVAAEGDYEHNIDAARQSLQAALTTAVNTHKKKYNADSGSRNQVLYFGMRNSAATALQAYQTSAQTEASTLVGAASTLLSAYAAYITSVEATRAQRMAADATVRHDFWTTIEGVFDAP